MPYFVYKLSPTVANLIKPMEQMAEFEKYKDARAYARKQRMTHADEIKEGINYKVIFAENSLDAEEKLSEVREQPILREWEK